MIVDHALFMQDFSVVNVGGTCTLNGVAFDCIFDDQSNDVLTMLEGRNPVATAPEASVVAIAADPRGKALVINGTSYTVRDYKPDGNGWAVMELSK